MEETTVSQPEIYDYIKINKKATIKQLLEYFENKYNRHLKSYEKKRLKTNIRHLKEKKLINKKQKLYFLPKKINIKKEERLHFLLDKNQEEQTIYESPTRDTEYIIKKYNLNPSFDDNALQELKTIKSEDITKNLNNRIDLTNEYIVTIDGYDAKDFDDAVSIKKEGEIYKLGIHIADVSNYVHKNTALDKEAYIKGNSYYLINYVIPMLPVKLSNDICSLKENEIRLTVSCFIDMDKNGNIIKFNFKKSFIKSKKRFTYSEVESLIKKQNINNVDYKLLLSELEEKNILAETSHFLKTAEEVTNILINQRLNSGSIDFETDEKIIDLDKKGRILDIRKKQPLFSERIIEELMLRANICASNILLKNKKGIYRVHDEPFEDKIDEFYKLLRALDFSYSQDKNNKRKSIYQIILESAKQTNYSNIISHKLLTCMKQAEYSIDNIGHFGLGFKNYTHFTSPIRRYSDLIVHRLLNNYLFNKKKQKYAKEELDDIAKQCNICERKSVDAERELNDIKSCRFMSGKIGEEFQAVVSGIIPAGIFVKLTDNFIEGFVHKKFFKEKLYFDENDKSFKDKNNNVIYNFGSELTVKTDKVDIFKKYIDFTVV